jgi:hypothetical protein
LADGRHEAGKDRMLETLTIMSDDDRDRPLIRNEDTLRRRAWIDLALASVRSRLRPAELGEAPAAPAPEPEQGSAESRLDGGRPHLYLVKDREPR